MSHEWLDELLLQKALDNAKDHAWAAVTESHAQKLWEEVVNELNSAVSHYNSEKPDDLPPVESKVAPVESIHRDIEVAVTKPRDVRLKIGLRTQPWSIHAEVLRSEGGQAIEKDGPYRYRLAATKSHVRIKPTSSATATEIPELVEELFSRFVQMMI
jgi:hypothetical protein